MPEPLPYIPHLPAGYASVARFCIGSPGMSCDFALLLAEAFDEVAEELINEGELPQTVAAVQTLAAELRRRAPGYA